MRSKYAAIFILVVLLLLVSLAAIMIYMATDRGTTTAGPDYALATGRAGDWPMLGHDHRRTNFNPDEHILSTANVKDLAPRWRALINPSGAPAGSAASVADGRLYIGGSASSGPNFFAFDAFSGARLWQTDLGYIKAVKGCADVGIGSTAAISGTMLVVGGGAAAYYALDTATGATMWHNPLDVGPGGFAWSSPLLAYGRAYYGVASYCDQPSVRAAVVSVDLASGKPLATLYIVPEGKAGGGVWHSPSITPDGSTLVVATGEDYEGYDGPLNRALISLDPHSLEVIQSNKQGPTDVDADWGSTPVILNDSQGRTLVAASHKDGTFRVYLIDRIAEGPLWSRSLGMAIALSPAYDPTFQSGGTLFFVGHEGGAKLYAVDPATGADRWPPVALPNYSFGNIAAANGLVFMNLSGVLNVYDEHTGTLLRSVVPEDAGHSWTGPSVARGFVYWTSGAYLNAWSLPGPDGVAPTP